MNRRRTQGAVRLLVAATAAGACMVGHGADAGAVPSGASVSVTPMASSMPPAAGAPVNGLIVQLRRGVPHASGQPKVGPGMPALVADAGRWKAVLASADLQPVATSPSLPATPLAPTRTPALMHLKAVGASAQLLQFERRLTADEANAHMLRLQQHPDVEWVVANEREQRLQTAPSPGAPNPPRDPSFVSQWWLHPVSGSDARPIDLRLRGVPGFQSAWQRNTGSTVVAVLDTGVTPHPELAGRLLPGYDFVSDWDATTNKGFANDGDGRDADPRDPGDGVTPENVAAEPGRFKGCQPQFSSWHGTIIAGMLAGLTDNGVGVAAMQWNARVVPVRVAGQCGADVADVIDGMRWAAGLPVVGVPANDNPARVINMSFGGTAACNPAYAQAIQEIEAAPGGGAVLVAAAGNGWSAPVRPANCPGAVGVVSLNRDGFKSNYSSFGSTVSLATVGGDDGDGAWGPLLADSGLLSITNFGDYVPSLAGYSRGFGTSFSAPVASGVAALMLSVNPALSAAQLRAGLALTTRLHVTSPYLLPCSESNPGRCACTTLTCGAGIVDADQATLYARDPATYVRPALQAAVIDTLELRQAAASGPDRPANAAPASRPASTGGGAMSWPLGLLLLLATAMLAVTSRAPGARSG